MRTKEEYQEALDLLACNSEHWVINRPHARLPIDKVFEESDNAKTLLQELIDNLPEKEYVEKTETIYVDIDRLIDNLKESK